MHDPDNSFGGSLGLDFRKWWRHVQPKDKRRGAYLIFRATSAALIRGQRLFKHCTRQIYNIFIQRYSFYPFIFLWTDT